MSVIRFGFVCIGDTRASVLDELDNNVGMVLGSVTGEPWVNFTDKVELIPVNHEGMLQGAPGSYIYRGEREMIFAGPTLLGDKPRFGDGFRPQSDPDNLT